MNKTRTNELFSVALCLLRGSLWPVFFIKPRDSPPSIFASFAYISSQQNFTTTILQVPKSVIVIGSGFAGLSAACFMAKEGWQVTVLEKNHTPGGRARQLKESGFVFDMGPSFYWMPDVFERYFAQFGKKTTDYYSLLRLDPSYRIYC